MTKLFWKSRHEKRIIIIADLEMWSTVRVIQFLPVFFPALQCFPSDWPHSQCYPRYHTVVSWLQSPQQSLGRGLYLHKHTQINEKNSAFEFMLNQQSVTVLMVHDFGVWGESKCDLKCDSKTEKQKGLLCLVTKCVQSLRVYNNMIIK